MNDSDINLVLRRAKRANSTCIDLSGRFLATIPNEILDYTVITKLNLSNNKINEIDPSIKALKNLKELDLSNNQITSLPREILEFDLSSLKLQGNPICKTFPGLNDASFNLKTELEKYFNKTDKPIEILIPKGKHQKKPSVDAQSREQQTKENPSFLSKSSSVIVSSDFIFDKDRINDVSYVTEVINQFKNKLKSFEVSMKSQTSSSKNTKPDELIVTKRNWMEQSNKIDNEVRESNKLMSFDMGNKYEETQNLLEKEILNNKRLKNEIDRLNKLVANSQSSIVSNDDVFKTVKEANFDQIALGEKIGQGGFSVIHKAKWNYIDVSIKLIFDPKITEELLAEFNNEIKMLSVLRHPNIVLLMGITRKPQKLSIITEFVENGCLFDFLHKTNKELSIPQRLRMIRQLARTFAFIHGTGVVHRDIKSFNILLDDNLNVKVCDFGLAKFKNELSFGAGQFAGTPAYMAPELFQKCVYDEKVDIYAFGTLVWEIMARKIPLDGLEVADIKSRCLNDDKLPMPKAFTNDIIDIINACRSLDPSKRPTFDDIVARF